MPYTPTTWVDGTTMGNQTRLNNLESQYSESTQSFNPDVFTAGFILNGLAATGTPGTTTITIGTGTAYLLQGDGTTRRRNFNSTTTKTTATPSATYYLYLQPDGTWYWSTVNAPALKSLEIATVTTDGSGNISVITDHRNLTPVILPSASVLSLPTVGGIAGQATTGTFGVEAVVAKNRITVTDTLQHSVCSITLPGTDMWFKASLNFWVSSGTGSANVTAQVTYTDPVTSTTAPLPFATYDGPPANIQNFSTGHPSYWTAVDFSAYAKAGTTVTIQYQNTGAGTLSDTVAGMIVLCG